MSAPRLPDHLPETLDGTLLISGMQPNALLPSGERYGGDEVLLMEGLARRVHGYVGLIRCMRHMFGDRSKPFEELPLDIVHRPVLDPSGEGLLVNGRAPSYWIHLGHGPSDDAILPDEVVLSHGDDERGPWWAVDGMAAHLRDAPGHTLWVGLPLCNGAAVAERLVDGGAALRAHGPTGSLTDAWSAVPCLHSGVESVARDLMMLTFGRDRRLDAESP